MSGDRLRQAATLLRERARHERAILDEWGPQRIALGVMESPGLRLSHEFNGTWTPGLALALADWLEEADEFYGDEPFLDAAARKVADAILAGGAS